MPSSESSASGYKFLSPIAKGGMGMVSLVLRKEGQFRRVYAMKRLRPELADEPEVRRQFTEEARIAGLIHHPNVVGVNDVGEDEKGPFLIMEYVDGISLSELAARAGTDIPEQVGIRIIRDVARGLGAAHMLCDHKGVALGLVHRDISPHNVLVGFDGVARLTDFGIAKALETQIRTSTGLLKGKFSYLSPEQLHFLPATQRSDLFALGLVLWEVLTGRPLYARATLQEKAAAILHEDPPDLYDLRRDSHPAIQQLLFELLAKSPEGRPDSAAEVLMRLDEILVDLVSQQGVIPTEDYVSDLFADLREERRARIDAAAAFSTAPPPAKRRFALPTALLAVGVAAALTVGGWMMFQPRDETATRRDRREAFGRPDSNTGSAAQTLAVVEVANDNGAAPQETVVARPESPAAERLSPVPPLEDAPSGESAPASSPPGRGAEGGQADPLRRGDAVSRAMQARRSRASSSRAHARSMAAQRPAVGSSQSMTEQTPSMQRSVLADEWMDP